jgi:hypothetical protein
MSTLKTSLVIGGFAAVGAVLVWQYQTHLALRGEIAAMQQQVQEIAASRASVRQDDPAAPAKNTEAENGRAVDRLELERLRREVTTLKLRTEEIARSAKTALARAEDAVPLRLIPASEWKNAGLGTAAAAMETFLWAAAGGDIDVMANALLLSGRTKERADAFFASLSESTRQQYGSPEKLLALMITRDTNRFSGMQVMSQVDAGPNDTLLFMRFANEDGKTKEEKIPFHRTPAGWKVQFPEKALDKYERMLKAPSGDGAK